MDALLTTSAFRLYAIASTAIALHLVLLALWTGTVRAIHKKFINEEDARLNRGTLVPFDIEPVQRVKRAHMNGQGLIPNRLIDEARGTVHGRKMERMRRVEARQCLAERRRVGEVKA